MIITKKSLPRRTFLRGMGVSLALPLLDAMVPALSAMAQTAANPVRRLGVVYVPNGMSMESWTPTSCGSGLRPHADPPTSRAVPRSASRVLRTGWTAELTEPGLSCGRLDDGS